MSRKVRARCGAEPTLRWLFILRYQANGEHCARVVERATKRHLAIARGTEDYVRRASHLYATSWEDERARRLAQGAVQP